MLAGCLVYCFDKWAGDLAGQDAILGMDFMVPAGVRLDLADEIMCFPDEMRIQLSGRRPLYGEKMRIWTDREKLWVIRGERWVPIVVRDPGRSQYLQITNISEEKKLLLDSYEEIGMWLALDSVPRSPGYVSVGSRRYREWQNLAYEATTESRSEDMDEQPEEPTGPLVERSVYPTPRKILQRGRLPQTDPVVVIYQALACDQEGPPMDPKSMSSGIPRVMPVLAKQEAAIEDQGRGALLSVSENTNGSRTSQESHPSVDDLPISEILSRPTSISLHVRSQHAEGLGATEDEQICYHEGGDLYAEDIGEGMAVVPDVPLTTEEVKIEDIQLDPTSNTPKEVDRLL
ncbi:hypothetical protein PC129_g21499 [Phytophthora cactorum]|uniref:Uncharacterized protein n=1 Tax=Phytophthora cactorum TaxID=29920 RepID=A0A8T1H5T7_9STRA|nr:hypothetical protein PC129_g21499 [Phytophthora cactorum]